MFLSLRDAAQQAGAAKSTILRAIKAGRLSATRTDDGGYQIDPAELLRVYPVDRIAPRSTAPNATVEAVAATPETVRNATLEAEIKGVRDLLAAAQLRADEWRGQAERWQTQADQWREQAQRLLLASPIIAPAPPTPTPPTVPAPRRSRWKWWQRQAG